MSKNFQGIVGDIIMKIGLFFPGYGSQFVGMGKELYDDSRIMQEYFEEASNCLDSNFVKLCFASSDAELAKMRNAYVSIFLVSSSLYALLASEEIVPNVVAGYGLGEYSALLAAGSISLPDGLYLLNKFATVYQQALSVLDVRVLRIEGMSIRDLAKLCTSCSNEHQRANIAAYESDKQAVVSGTSRAISCIRDHFSVNPTVTVQDLDQEYGLHSPLMNPIVEKFAMYLEKVDFKDLKIPLINCVDGVQIKGGESAKYGTIRQISEPILWNEVIDNFVDCDLIIGVGPGKKIIDLVQERYPEKQFFTLNNKSDIEYIKEFIGKKQEQNG